MKVIYQIDKHTGETIVVQEIKEDVEKEQFLITEGANTGFTAIAAVRQEDGTWIQQGHYKISKHFNSDGNEELSIKIKDKTIKSIKRILPKIEFELIYKDNEGKRHSKISENIKATIKELAN